MIIVQWGIARPISSHILKRAIYFTIAGPGYPSPSYVLGFILLWQFPAFTRKWAEDVPSTKDADCQYHPNNYASDGPS